MTDYNDGKWHGWNGGECPVHPMSEVRAMTEMGRELNCKAKNIAWSRFGSGTDIIAFRVVKEHKEAREFWIRYDESKQVSVIGSPIDHYNAKPCEIIHVREVIE